ncbi:MAG: hypothetical protein ACYCX2_11180 [Christensenellales bacterium]
MWEIILSAAALCIFAASLVFLCKPALQQTGFLKSDKRWNTLQQSSSLKKEDLLKLLYVFLASRLFLHLLGYTILALGGLEQGFFESLPRVWKHSTDVNQYLGIAEFGYRTAGDPRFQIVFFPLYPAFLGLIGRLAGNYYAGGMILSNFFLFFAVIELYKLCLLEGYSKGTGMRAVCFLLFSPASFFFSMPMSESLFLLTCIYTLYYARKGDFFACGIWGMMAALTRSLGLLIFIPAFMECLAQLGANGIRSWRTKRFLKQFTPLLMIPLGTFIYLLMNKLITGTWLQFLVYQREHWSQQFGLFTNTVNYITKNMLTYDLAAALCLWMPQLIAIFTILVLTFIGAKKIRPSYTVFSLAYFFVAIAPTWLLSGPRYLMCTVPVYLVLGILTEKKSSFLLCFGIEFLMLIAFTTAFVCGMPIF